MADTQTATPLKIRRRSLGDEAAGVIRDSIIRGDIAQGARVTEEGLAEELDVSRASIREAFLILATEGLVVQHVRNKYNEVVQFGQSDIEDILDLRFALESLCAMACVENGTVPFDRLKEQLSKIREITDSRTDIADHVVADLEFHEILVNASGRKRAILVWKSLSSQLQTLIFAVFKAGQERALELGPQGHEELLGALVSGERERIETTLHKHILETNLPALRAHLW